MGFAIGAEDQDVFKVGGTKRVFTREDHADFELFVVRANVADFIVSNCFRAAGEGFIADVGRILAGGRGFTAEEPNYNDNKYRKKKHDKNEVADAMILFSVVFRRQLC